MHFKFTVFWLVRRSRSHLPKHVKKFLISITGSWNSSGRFPRGNGWLNPWIGRLNAEGLGHRFLDMHTAATGFPPMCEKQSGGNDSATDTCKPHMLVPLIGSCFRIKNVIGEWFRNLLYVHMYGGRRFVVKDFFVNCQLMSL